MVMKMFKIVLFVFMFLKYKLQFMNQAQLQFVNLKNNSKRKNQQIQRFCFEKHFRSGNVSKETLSQ